MSDAPAHHGTPRALFEFAAETMVMAHISAELAATYAGIGDAAGLEYQTRRLIAYVKAVIPTVKEIRSARAAVAVEAEFA